MLEKSGNVHGWPLGGFPAPQGPFYCGVGSESVYGRPLAEAHMDACIRVRCLYRPPGPAQSAMGELRRSRGCSCLSAVQFSFGSGLLRTLACSRAMWFLQKMHQL